MNLNYDLLPVALERVNKVLFPYQKQAVGRAVTNKVCLFDMLMGYGKTVCALTALFSLKPKRILIICSKNSMSTWVHQIEEWFPEFYDPSYFTLMLAQGNSKKARKKLWDRNTPYTIVTKETLTRDLANVNMAKYDAYVIDECHKLPKHTTKTFKTMELMLRDVPIKLMLTGTWVKKHAGTGWRQLNLLDRKRFKSYWGFINTFCEMENNGFGKSITGPKNTIMWRKTIQNYVFRYHKIDGTVPEAVRKLVYVDMDPAQGKLYKQMSDDLYAELSGENLLVIPTSLTLFIRHRQLLNCPKQLDPNLNMGAAFEGIMEHLDDTQDSPEEQHCVLFSPFKKSIPFYKEALEAKGYKVFTFMGGMKAMDVGTDAQAFRRLKGTKSVAICVIDFAESFDLGTALRTHFIGLHTEGDPMKQAEARVARASSEKGHIIVHKYWLYNNTLDIERKAIIADHAENVRQLFRKVDDVKNYLQS